MNHLVLRGYSFPNCSRQIERPICYQFMETNAAGSGYYASYGHSALECHASKGERPPQRAHCVLHSGELVSRDWICECW